MMKTSRRSRAFSLIELLIVIALLAVILALAAGPFRDFILLQRLRSVQAQLLTDMSYARSEAISKGTFVQMRVQSSSSSAFTGTCYIIYSRTDATGNNACDCTASTAAARCAAGTQEIKTVLLPSSDSISVAVPPSTTRPAMLTINPRTGGVNIDVAPESISANPFWVETQIDMQRRFRTMMSVQGRLQVCSPDITIVGGTAC